MEAKVFFRISWFQKEGVYIEQVSDEFKIFLLFFFIILLIYLFDWIWYILFFYHTLFLLFYWLVNDLMMHFLNLRDSLRYKINMIFFWGNRERVNFFYILTFRSWFYKFINKFEAILTDILSLSLFFKNCLARLGCLDSSCPSNLNYFFTYERLYFVFFYEYFLKILNNWILNSNSLK